ncbi:MAG: leucine-rich repeat domain-containing protein [Bacteroidales bacterium]
MKKLKFLWMALICLFSATSCSTEDVDFVVDEPSESSNLYALKDVAFAEYLMYNATLPATDANALPFGICISRNDTFFLDVDKAAKVKAVYLVKDSRRVEALKAAGVASAEVKIENLDGIQHFAACSNLKLTSNTILGKLDLSPLSKLDTLEMNANYTEELIVPASITRLRYNASSNASETQRLTAIDLSQASNLFHVSLTGHAITKEGLKLPVSYSKLKELDLSGNAGAPFEIPEDLFNQLTTKNGVEIANGGTEPEEPADNEYQIKDAAFGDYLVYLTETVTDESLKLPAGTAYKKENAVFIDKKIAAGYKGLLNISKASSYITALQGAGVATADVKIADADGLQFFTGITELIATSNAFTTKLPLTTLTNLESLVVRTAGVDVIDLSSNTNLTYLDLQGSSKLAKLSEVNLSANTKLITVNLSANAIDPAKFVLPATYPALRTLNMGNNKVNNTTVTYVVPAALFDQLGNESTDKAGLTRGD